MTLTGLFNFPKFSKAKCLDGDPDFFFPTSRVELEERLPQLQHFCGTCIHQAECLTYAIDNQISDGFWAGKTAEEIKELWKEKENLRHHGLGDILNNLSLGFSEEETARILGIELDSVKRTLLRARQKGLIE